jgi:hypothetical protein
MKSTTINDVIDLPAKGPLATRLAAKGSAEKAADGNGSVSTFGRRVKARWDVVAAAFGAAAVSPRAWAAITCVMLGLSGGLRYWKGMEFSARTEEVRESPFPLAELPKVIGTWRFDEGSESKLDPQIVPITGATDHFLRNYTDDKTGQTVSVLAIYGVSSTVPFHIPDVCYPAAGYRRVESGQMTDYTLKIPGSDKVARYRGGVYSKRLGAFTEYSEVVYSFRHVGAWLPDAAARWKSFRSHPGMFKIQIGRSGINDFDVENGASASLLGEFMREIDDRLDKIAAAKQAAQAKLRKSDPARKPD